MKRFSPTLSGTDVLSRLLRKIIRRYRPSLLLPRHVPTEEWRASCFASMKPLSPELYNWIVGIKAISMLHYETLMGLYHFALASEGMILEVGSYIGGATVVLAKALQQWKKSRSRSA